MNGYPIVHTKSNPIQIAIVQDTLPNVQKGIVKLLDEEDYIEIHDIIITHISNGIHSAVIPYKIKHKGEIVK